MRLTPADTCEWGEFAVGDLFTVRASATYKEKLTELDDGGDTPILRHSAENFGVCGHTTRPPLERGGVIVCSPVNISAIHWVPCPFCVAAGSALNVLEPKDDISEDAARYFMCIFRRVVSDAGFGFGHTLTPPRAAKLKIKVPVTPDGSPDYKSWGGSWRRLIADM